MWQSVMTVGAALLFTIPAHAHAKYAQHHPKYAQHHPKVAPLPKSDLVLHKVEVIPPVEEQTTAKRKEILCLTLEMYQEARGESEIGQRAVAHVILNLASGRTICDTLWHSGKFQWVKRSADRLVPAEQPVWREVQATAMRVLTKDDPDPTSGATMFYNDKLCKPVWAEEANVTAKIGNHVFIRPDRRAQDISGAWDIPK